MRRFIIALAAVAAIVAIGATAHAKEAPVASQESDAPASLVIGDAAPMIDVKMMTADGQEVALADARGEKGTLVVFTCNSCPWAQAWEGRVAALGNAWSKKGVGVIAINSNDPEVKAEDDLDGMRARAKKLGMKFAYAVDATSDLARAFGATRTPEAFLFDADGKLVYHGAIDDNAREPAKVKNRYLEDAVKAVSAGKAVPTAETKALGCSIKFRSKA